MSSDTITYGSLFSGVGGFDLGCDHAGWRCEWQVEKDEQCREVLEHHWPGLDRYDDVRTVDGATLTPVDVITYGFPCQDLSVAGKRAGLDGERTGLFFETIRIIREMREATHGAYPAVAIAENVVGLLTADGGAAMGRCLDALAELGSVAVEWRVLDARYFGVPQRRRRVFLVACFNPRAGRSEQIFPDGQIHARDLLEDPHLVGFYRTQGTADDPCCGILPPLKTITPCAIAGGSIEPRMLTPIESERAMGWPDDHTKHGTDGRTIADSVRYRMCGNGVVAPVAAYVARSVTRAVWNHA
jgi:DNA (cytosine-5)-methyltransferase 1